MKVKKTMRDKTIPNGLGFRPLPYANAATERNKIVRIIKITGKSTFIFIPSFEAIVSRDKGNAFDLFC